MSSPDKPQTTDASADPTADYRKYPKGPNFLLIVILACISFLIILAAAVFLVGKDGQQLLPHKRNPTPNSLIRPLRSQPPTDSVC